MRMLNPGCDRRCAPTPGTSRRLGPSIPRDAEGPTRIAEDAPRLPYNATGLSPSRPRRPGPRWLPTGGGCARGAPAAGRRGARAPGYHDLHGHREDVKSVEVQPNPEGRQVQYSRDSRRPIAAPYPGHSLPSPRSSSIPHTVENIGAGDRFSLRPDPPDSITWPLSPHIFDRGHHCLPVSRGSSF
jgi:hypothetical protein